MVGSRRIAVGSAAALIALLLAAATCAGSTPRLPAGTTGAGTAGPATDPWLALLQQAPLPYLLPLPTSGPTILDGTYTKVEPLLAEHVPCKRCPDYLPEGGVWKISLNRGTYHIFHAATGWRSLGSYVVSRDRISKVDRPDRLVLFNDPYCPQVVGLYAWRVEGGTLALEEIDDACSYRYRAANLVHLPWQSCQPPTPEAGATDHWPKPPGCE